MWVGKTPKQNEKIFVVNNHEGMLMMVKSLLIAGFAGAALLTSPVAQAQTRVVPPRTQLPSTGSAFAIKNGGAFANQGGIANQAGRPGAGLIGNDGGSLVGKSGAGILSHNGGLARPR